MTKLITFGNRWEHDNTFQAPAGGNFGSLEDDGAHTNDFC